MKTIVFNHANKVNNNTINKSTQTQNTKVINSVNVNLNINNQNLISNNNNIINNNYNNKKFEKKNGYSKNINNNTNNNYVSTTNVNINNNLNFNSVKTNSNNPNNINISKSNIPSKEYSKYDFPKNNKKNSFNKSSNSNINNNYMTLNDSSKSPIKEKDFSNKIANLSSIVNSNNIKEFNYSYSFNNKNICGNNNLNSYNINLNYDLNYENSFGSNCSNNSYLTPFTNSRKKSNNWNEKSLLSNNNNSNYFDSSRNYGINNNIISNSNIGFNLAKPNNNNDFLAYVFKLHYDIVNYHKNVVDIVNSLKDIKVNVINYIEKLLKDFIEYELSLDVFGSFASDLSIESSDIDLKVNILNQDSININYEELIFNLVKKFNSLNIFEFVMPIHTASVPIIKLVKYFLFNLFIFFLAILINYFRMKNKFLFVFYFYY